MNSELLDDLEYLEREVPQQIYVGFWKRLLATLLDGIVLSVMTTCWVAVTELLGLVLPNMSNYLLQDIGIPIFLLLYLPLCESSPYQASIGKYILGAKVVDGKGERITLLRALARLVSKMLSYITAAIGFLMIAFTDKKRGLHDLIVDTYVIEVSKNKEHEEQLAR